MNPIFVQSVSALCSILKFNMVLFCLVTLRFGLKSRINVMCSIPKRLRSFATLWTTSKKKWRNVAPLHIYAKNTVSTGAMLLLPVWSEISFWSVSMIRTEDITRTSALLPYQNNNLITFKGFWVKMWNELRQEESIFLRQS